MSSNPATPPRRHTRRGPSPYPDCTHPSAMLSGYIEQLAETPWPIVHTGAICGRCGAVDVGFELRSPLVEGDEA
jgi:hypothetical protein